jgi:ribonuclease Z
MIDALVGWDRPVGILASLSALCGACALCSACALCGACASAEEPDMPASPAIGTAVPTASTAAPAATADDFTVTLLGTGSPVPSPDRFGNSTLIQVAGQRLVLDLGRGTTIRLFQKKIPFGTITAHFLSHLHSDHVNGLSDLWMSGWIQTAFGGRQTPFVIHAPAGTEAMMAGLWEAFSEDRRIRLADEGNPMSGIEIDAHDFTPGTVYSVAASS